MSEEHPVVKQEADVSDQPGMAPELFREFLDNQSRELEIRSRELELQKQKDDHGFDFGKRALDAQVVDRREQRVFQLKSRRSSYIFAVIVGLIFLALLITALILNKDQVALEIIKAIIFITTGGAGGYAIGRSRQNSDDSN